MDWTQEEILDYNKKCADFRGWKNLNDDSFPEYIDKLGNFYPLKELKFHSDWNWIMAVVDAIQKIRPLIISHNHCEIHMYKEGKNISINIATNSTITAVVQAINQFLIWYSNEQRT